MSMRRKLDDNQVRFIRKHYMRGALGYKFFAAMFGVSAGTVKCIISGRSYKEIV